MRYKDVFLIWFWADIIIAAGALITSLVTKNFAEGKIGFALLIALIGLLISLPSLVAMLGFHAIYSSYNKSNSNYLLPYSLLILMINGAYLLVGNMEYQVEGDLVKGFFCCTSFAGILAFFIMDQRIKKRMQLQKNKNQ